MLALPRSLAFKAFFLRVEWKVWIRSCGLRHEVYGEAVCQGAPCNTLLSAWGMRLILRMGILETHRNSGSHGVLGTLDMDFVSLVLETFFLELLKLNNFETSYPHCSHAKVSKLLFAMKSFLKYQKQGIILIHPKAKLLYIDAYPDSYSKLITACRQLALWFNRNNFGFS